MLHFKPLFAVLGALVAGCAVAASGPAYAQTAKPATIKVGSSAPKLAVGEWVKGTPVKIGDGKVHVVEFWATWCGPCRMTIPHLTELARKYKGKADFTGVSVWEEGTNVPAQVKKFVKEMGAQMDYHVARDDAKGTTAKTWMDAAKQDGIPTAFVVDKKGKIVWIGHPMGGLDEALAKATAKK